jgi:hypothetical protein
MPQPAEGAIAGSCGFVPSLDAFSELEVGNLKLTVAGLLIQAAYGDRKVPSKYIFQIEDDKYVAVGQYGILLYCSELRSSLAVGYREEYECYN